VRERDRSRPPSPVRVECLPVLPQPQTAAGGGGARPRPPAAAGGAPPQAQSRWNSKGSRRATAGEKGSPPLEQRALTHSSRVAERLDSHERRPHWARRQATTGACRAARPEGEERSARAARGPRSSGTTATTTTTHIGHDLLPLASNTATGR